MKKIVLILSSIFIFKAAVSAQDLSTPQSKDFPNGMESLKEMQQQMMQLFGRRGSDSTQSFAFQLDTNFMKIDTSFSKAFGFSFDGENWKPITPNTPEGINEGGQMGDMFKQMQEQMKKLMPDMNQNFDLSEMFKGFGNMFGGDATPMPRVQPKDKKRLGEEETKDKKYKTEKL